MTSGWIIITRLGCLTLTLYNLQDSLSLSVLSLFLLCPGWVFLVGGLNGQRGEIKRSEVSFHWQTVSVKDRGLMIGAARNIIYPESEDVWLLSSSPSSSAATSFLYKCTIKMRCSHNTVSPSDTWPINYQLLTAVIGRPHNDIIYTVRGGCGRELTF